MVALKSHHGSYVVAEQDGRARADRPAVGPWEQWTMVRNGDGTVSFLSHHGKYLVAESDGRANANREAIGPWEKWLVIPHSEGTTSFRSHHGKFLVAESNGELNANREAIGPWEKFQLLTVNQRPPIVAPPPPPPPVAVAPPPAPPVPPAVNGRNVREVGYGRNGLFQQQPNGTWAERTEQGQRFTFTEKGRDEWSVYLRKQDGADIQLDLWKKKIFVNGGALYDITSAENRVTQAPISAPAPRPPPVAVAPPPVLGGPTVALWSHHGRYVVAEQDGRARANRPARGPWEQWTMVRNGDGTVSFRSHHGKYLVAESDGRANANREAIGSWERWQMIRHPDGTVSFRSHHGKYLVAENNGELNANREAIGPWEKFQLLTGDQQPSQAAAAPPPVAVAPPPAPPAPPAVNGRNVRTVRYGARGVFQQEANGTWIERTDQGRRFNFTEQGRDQWSVYLRKEDGAKIQLDLWKKKILLNGGVLYDITSAAR